MGLMRWLSLPLRAPLLILLFGVSAVMGHQWTLLSPRFSASSGLPRPNNIGKGRPLEELNRGARRVH